MASWKNTEEDLRFYAQQRNYAEVSFPFLGSIPLQPLATALEFFPSSRKLAEPQTKQEFATLGVREVQIYGCRHPNLHKLISGRYSPPRYACVTMYSKQTRAEGARCRAK
ncbi:hypothetical protein QQF64_015088 [Cirrhinus molitorella]|uniref:Uncharacterized protein n=1 Tax=Cirrhinus molitorella TaxID=172907 RepID=A0ABR3NTY2_9TELE